MENLKKYNEFTNEGLGSFLTIFGGLAIIQVLWNLYRKKTVGKSIEDKDFEEIDKFLNKDFKDKKKLVGKIINNDEFAQIIYKYGSDDNMITIIIDKVQKTLDFKWDYRMAIMPYWDYDNKSQYEIDLSDEEFHTVMVMFNKLSNQKFRDKEESTLSYKYSSKEGGKSSAINYDLDNY